MTAAKDNGAIARTVMPRVVAVVLLTPDVPPPASAGSPRVSGHPYLIEITRTVEAIMRRGTGILVAVVVAFAWSASPEAAVVPPVPAVTAIDILLEPDATMLKHAKAVNARLLKAYPKGFALDATHRPHITLIQRFVRTADLDKVYAAAGRVLAGAKVTGMKLEAFKHYYIPIQDTGVAGIVARPTPELIKLQQDLIAVVAPFTVETGTWAAFVTTPNDPGNAALIDYVSTFVPKASGEHFNPHVTTGVASRSYLDQMLAEPFKAFTFSPAGAAVYQLGQFGTAAKKLKAWDLKP
jgi:hypothetical protein